jgi:hypothetical protein
MHLDIDTVTENDVCDNKNGQAFGAAIRHDATWSLVSLSAALGSRKWLGFQIRPRSSDVIFKISEPLHLHLFGDTFDGLNHKNKHVA